MLGRTGRVGWDVDAGVDVDADVDADVDVEVDVDGAVLATNSRANCSRGRN
jgi:hypothetical protein